MSRSGCDDLGQLARFDLGHRLLDQAAEGLLAVGVRRIRPGGTQGTAPAGKRSGAGKRFIEGRFETGPVSVSRSDDGDPSSTLRLQIADSRKHERTGRKVVPPVGTIRRNVAVFHREREAGCQPWRRRITVGLQTVEESPGCRGRSLDPTRTGLGHILPGRPEACPKPARIGFVPVEAGFTLNL